MLPDWDMPAVTRERMGRVTSGGFGRDGPSFGRHLSRPALASADCDGHARSRDTHARAGRSAGNQLVADALLADVGRVRASAPERLALAAIGLSVTVLGVDSALEAHDGLELVWLAVGLLDLALEFASVRGTVRPFRRAARLLRLPPMAQISWAVDRPKPGAATSAIVRRAARRALH